jgi:hypothetical protein
MFHQTFGYYAHGVDETTAVLPRGWQDRLVRVETPGTANAIGWCLDLNDLAVSKLAAGRDKDVQFVSAMFRAHLADAEMVQQRLSEIPNLPTDLLEALKARLSAISHR